jgi:hypothetical protein
VRARNYATQRGHNFSKSAKEDNKLPGSRDRVVPLIRLSKGNIQRASEMVRVMGKIKTG